MNKLEHCTAPIVLLDQLCNTKHYSLHLDYGNSLPRDPYLGILSLFCHVYEGIEHPNALVKKSLHSKSNIR